MSRINKGLERIDIPDLGWISPRTKVQWQIKGVDRAKPWPGSQDTGSLVAATVAYIAESLSSGNLQSSGGKKIHQKIYCIMSNSGQQHEEKQNKGQRVRVCMNPVLDEGSGKALNRDLIEFWAEGRTGHRRSRGLPQPLYLKTFPSQAPSAPHQYQRS